jgi:hypothetical protein
VARAHRYGIGFLNFDDPLQSVGGLSREAFIRGHERCGTGFGNVLTLEGWWYGDGEEGLHSACGGRAVCPHAPDIAPGTHRAVQRYLEGISDDALLVRLRLHV